MFGRGESVALAASAADAQARFDEIVDLLVAAGYHRARISALSPFDKIVGGMAWCMTATSVDVDVEFIENATIGQKVKIGEGIERALKFMKCRIPLQAHQIQGLDYAAIFPVVQWLVKQAYTFREEIAEATRRLSASQFGKNFELPADAELAKHRATARPMGQKLCACYAPTRRFRPKSVHVGGASLHARRVLMEFGMQLSALGAADAADAAEGKGGDKPLKGKGGAAGEPAEAGATAALSEALTEMAETNQDAEQAVSQSRIGKLVSMGAGDIQHAALDFAKKSEALLSSGEMAAAHRLRGEREATERQLEHERRQLQAASEKTAAAQAALGAAEAGQAVVAEQLAQQANCRGQLQAEMAELEEKASGANPDELGMCLLGSGRWPSCLSLSLPSVPLPLHSPLPDPLHPFVPPPLSIPSRPLYSLPPSHPLSHQLRGLRRSPPAAAKLQELVALCERMSAQKAEFKRQCAKQMEAMTAELAALEQDQDASADDDTQNLREIERLHVAEDGKAAQMRRLVGQKGREIAQLHRQVDDIPTSAELMQYERRFRELYSQVAAKLEETKKFYALYNTLEEKKGFLAKEVSLLNSIHENYTKAAAGNKDRIVESVEGILKGVQQSLAKVEQRLKEALNARDGMNVSEAVAVGPSAPPLLLGSPLPPLPSLAASARPPTLAAFLTLPHRLPRSRRSKSRSSSPSSVRTSSWSRTIRPSASATRPSPFEPHMASSWPTSGCVRGELRRCAALECVLSRPRLRARCRDGGAQPALPCRLPATVPRVGRRRGVLRAPATRQRRGRRDLRTCVLRCAARAVRPWVRHGSAARLGLRSAPP